MNSIFPSRPARRLIVVAVLVATGAAWGAVVLTHNGAGTAGSGGGPTFTVRRGPLTISVTEAGTIKAQQQQILKSEVEGQTTIIYLIPEGTLVKKGELLVQLDSSWLEDDKVEQQIRVQNAEASFIRARENLAVVMNQAQSDTAKAELDDRFAGEDLKQYIQGEYPQELKEAESKIILAQVELELATEKHAGSEQLYKERFISNTELKSDKLAMNRADLEHDLAVAARKLLEDYTHVRRKDELESNIKQMAMALQRVRLKGKADEVQAGADFKAKQAEYKQQQDKLAKVEKQITKTKIFAPMDGMVVYSTSAKGSWRGNAEPLDEGQTVRERQELIYLPTTDAMAADVKVHESSLDKVRLDLPVQITVDALPGKEFTGRVVKIAPLPDAQSIWLNPDLKVYATLIHIDPSEVPLRTGMSCRAQIIVEEYEDAMYVPIQAVMRVGGQTTAYMVAGNQARPTPVTIGLDNNRMVHVTDGLDVGDTVLLTPPLADAAATR